MTDMKETNITRTLSAIKKKVANDNEKRFKECSKDRLKTKSEKKL